MRVNWKVSVTCFVAVEHVKEGMMMMVSGKMVKTVLGSIRWIIINNNNNV